MTLKVETQITTLRKGYNKTSLLKMKKVFVLQKGALNIKRGSFKGPGLKISIVVKNSLFFHLPLSLNKMYETSIKNASI